MLRGRKLEDIIIIDNAIENFGGQIENGIYIPSFFGDENDRELSKVFNFLLSVSKTKDVRPFVKQFSGILNLFQEYIKY